jgi:hypothetical protein
MILLSGHFFPFFRFFTTLGDDFHLPQSNPQTKNLSPPGQANYINNQGNVHIHNQVGVNGFNQQVGINDNNNQIAPDSMHYNRFDQQPSNSQQNQQSSLNLQSVQDSLTYYNVLKHVSVVLSHFLRRFIQQSKDMNNAAKLNNQKQDKSGFNDEKFENSTNAEAKLPVHHESSHLAESAEFRGPNSFAINKIGDLRAHHNSNQQKSSENEKIDENNTNVFNIDDFDIKLQNKAFKRWFYQYFVHLNGFFDEISLKQVYKLIYADGIYNETYLTPVQFLKKNTKHARSY